MTLLEAIEARHSVRKYKDEPIPDEVLATLRNKVWEINKEAGLHVQLVTDEPKAFAGFKSTSGVFSYGAFSGVRNYFVMAGPKGKEAEEKIGYFGEELVLLSQTLGLNTCWVGLTYKKIPGAFTLREGDVVHCVIALGYGTIPGVQHPMKPEEQFFQAEGVPPEWFRKGLEAALLAPTAINQQKFRFILHEGNQVEAKPLFSMAGYTHIDLGIVKYHFELAAGKDNFIWVRGREGE